MPAAFALYAAFPCDNEMIYSPAIDAAVALAGSEGNAVVEVSTGWTKVREVVFMTSPMTDLVRSRLTADLRLRYWKAQPTPHNKPDEGFTDDIHGVSVLFPIVNDVDSKCKQATDK